MNSQSVEYSQTITFVPSRVRVGYRVEPTAEGVRVTFPPAGQGVGWVILPMFVMFAASLPLGAWAIHSLSSHRHHAAVVPMWVPLAMALSVGLAAAANYLLTNGLHREIELDRQSLRVVRKSGPMRWVLHDLAVSEVRQIEMNAEAVKQAKAELEAMPSDLQLRAMSQRSIGEQATPIQAYTSDGQTVRLCFGEATWMMPLARDLNEQLDHAKHGQWPNMTTPHRREAARSVDFSTLNIDEPRAGSRMTVDREAERMTITLHPLGLMSNADSRAFAKFALVDFGITTGVIAAGCTGYWALRSHLAPLNILQWLGIVYIPGVMLVLALVMIARLIAKAGDQAVVEVRARGLVIRDRQWLGQRKWEVPRDHVIDIRVCATGERMQKEMRNRTAGLEGTVTGQVFALHVQDANGMVDDMFAGREKRDLQWLADTLRAGMELPGEAASTSWSPPSRVSPA